MKKFLHIALLIGAVSALMCSCGPKEPETDGKAEVTSFVITAEANPELELTRNYGAVINNVEGTILVALPEGVEVIEAGAFDTEGLVINVYFESGEIPKGFADGWHKGKITYGYEPPVDDDETKTGNEPWWNQNKDKESKEEK